MLAVVLRLGEGRPRSHDRRIAGAQLLLQLVEVIDLGDPVPAVQRWDLQPLDIDASEVLKSDHAFPIRESLTAKVLTIV